MTRQKLSVVVLTHNEEKNIGACLDTVSWADERIVVDDFSDDRTADIVKANGALFVQNRLEGDFSRQRNFGNERATGDWVLQMDADERVTAGLRAKIEEVLNDGGSLDAYCFTRINNFCGKFLQHGGDISHKPLRLFRKGKARFSGDRIHEKLVVDGAVGELDAVMEHYNFPDVGHYVETQNFYTTIEANELARTKGKIPERELRHELTWGPVKLFFKIYVKKQGYRDGIHGLVFAVLSAWRRFLIWAKYWELHDKK
jgi:glycosyltransferase involved in cell wall biosynthesis